MAFNNPASKLERAVRQFLIQQGKATADDCYTVNGSTDKTLPNRVVGGVAFSPERPYRPEGTVHLQIDHRFNAVVQPTESDKDSARVQIDAFLGDTMDSFGFGDGQSTEAVANAITAAGRSLAVSDGTADGDRIAQNNSDMVNFRCDWFKRATPNHTRGKTPDNSTVWIESLHFLAFVSSATN